MVRGSALVLVALLLGSRDAGARREPMGWLDLEVSVPDAEIQIDGKVYGLSPLGGPLKLYKGTHTVKVTKPGHAEFLDVVKIEVGKTVTVEVDLFPLSAPITITSRPPGALIFVDGQPVGTTPFTGEIDPGPRKIRVTLEGYLPAEKTVDLLAGGTYTVAFPLVREPPPPEALRRGPSRPVYEKWWFWAATSVVAVGVTAIVLATGGEDPFGGSDRIVTPTW